MSYNFNCSNWSNASRSTCLESKKMFIIKLNIIIINIDVERNCKEINENCDVIDVIFANDENEIYLVVMMFKLNKLDNYHGCY